MSKSDWWFFWVIAGVFLWLMAIDSIGHLAWG
jgi:hypothetical protein